MKKLLILALIIVLCLSLASIALAVESDFIIEDGVLTEYTGPGGYVVIPEGVTKIGGSAFYGCHNLISVYIPEGVTEIEYFAFQYTDLESVKFPSSLSKIGMDAFAETPWLNSMGDFPVANGILVQYLGDDSVVTIPDGVTKINEYAFMDKQNLTKVTIPEGVTEIGKEAFLRCTSLRDVDMPDSVTSIEMEAFMGTPFENTPWLSDRGDFFISGGTLIQYQGQDSKVTIPQEVTRIGEYAFKDCVGIKQVEIPDSVVYIGEGAFQGCTGLTDIVIPNSVLEIGGGAFCRCTGLTKVDISKALRKIDVVTFDSCTSLTEVTIPDGVTEIGTAAFSGCKNLAQVVIPDSVMKIGDMAFFGCTKLTGVELSDDVEIGKEAFNPAAWLDSTATPEPSASVPRQTISSTNQDAPTSSDRGKHGSTLTPLFIVTGIVVLLSIITVVNMGVKKKPQSAKKTDK